MLEIIDKIITNNDKIKSNTQKKVSQNNYNNNACSNWKSEL